MKLVWAQFALDDREAVFSHIERENSSAAAHIDDEIARSVRRLLEFPESGRLGRIAGTRELVIARTPYIAAYVIMADRIKVLRILHGAQMWPAELYSE